MYPGTGHRCTARSTASSFPEGLIVGTRWRANVLALQSITGVFWVGLVDLRYSLIILFATPRRLFLNGHGRLLKAGLPPLLSSETLGRLGLYGLPVRYKNSGV